jgi:hypothetical protein
MTNRSMDVVAPPGMSIIATVLRLWGTVTRILTGRPTSHSMIALRHRRSGWIGCHADGVRYARRPWCAMLAVVGWPYRAAEKVRVESLGVRLRVVLAGLVPMLVVAGFSGRRGLRPRWPPHG